MIILGLLVVMEKYQHYQTIKDKSKVLKMQRTLEKLMEEIRRSCQQTRYDIVWLTQQSQMRLMKFKELYLHRGKVKDTEIKLVYTKLTSAEKQIADMGTAEITFIIDALDKEIQSFTKKNKMLGGTPSIFHGFTNDFEP
ncbi:hypothetical protein [Vibrio sagamiensis]|uniref:Uncharacterized protein n=1 Tax=Vibrio sagamiensis NBRC 104589 TaxID=1219064 RepID=A0A511QGY2_9VIBR|nr:hypothetical protein [Vibrio sagamiensis]GEM76575.1 hypothetical protein VSA01S_26870 [Vibrio sagamiensis NBRC 104589]